MLFTTAMLKELRRPGVYIYRHGDTDKVLYVGMTFYGIDRAFDKEHKVLKERSNLTLLWIPCEDTDTATLLEEYLIHAHNPEFNRIKTQWLCKEANRGKIVKIEALAVKHKVAPEEARRYFMKQTVELGFKL